MDNYDYILGAFASDQYAPLLPADRRRHVYIVGQTGTGKTALLYNLMLSDLTGGRGFCFLDPHGDACKAVAAATPKRRINDVIYFDPSDPSHAMSYNPLDGVGEHDRATRAANIVSAFKAIWGSSWGPRLEYVFTNALRLLLDNEDQSLIALPRLFVDERFRKRLLKNCADPVIRFYWEREFPSLDDRQRAEALSPIQNKVGVLLANPFLRAVLCQNTSTIDLENIMNSGKVLIVNLSKGNLGVEPAHLLGALLISGISQAAEARRNIDEEERVDFTLYVDEFQNFATDAFASILSEARKWRLCLVAANQHVAQLSPDLQHAVFGNAGTIVAFRVGALDAPMIAAELGMEDARTLRETSNYHAWLRLMYDGMPREPHFISTLPPSPPAGDRFGRVVDRSRSRHGVPRSRVNSRIADFFESASVAPARPKRRRRPD